MILAAKVPAVTLAAHLGVVFLPSVVLLATIPAVTFAADLGTAYRPAATPPADIPAVTFAGHPGIVYLPARETAEALCLTFTFDPVTESARIQGHPLDFNWPTLGDGTRLVPLEDLAKWGVKVNWLRLTTNNRAVQAQIGRKHIVVSLTAHEFKAWQGKLLVLDCGASPGRPGHPTPLGRYRTGKKERMHISTIYGSPMPWSVHLAGPIFIHGSEMFDDGVGSHGCIRLPVDRVRNWAEYFYDWAEPGIPVRVLR